MRLLLSLDLLHLQTCLYHVLLFQKKELRAEKCKILSDEAKRLFQKESGLLKAAEDEFKSIYNFYNLSNQK